jgi:hypothetical protein
MKAKASPTQRGTEAEAPPGGATILMHDPFSGVARRAKKDSELQSSDDRLKRSSRLVSNGGWGVDSEIVLRSKFPYPR